MDLAFHRRRVTRAAIVVVLAVFSGALFAVEAQATEVGDRCELAPAMGVRAALSPGPAPQLDVAFLPDDPDFESAPLQSIDVPDEGTMWTRAGFKGGAAVNGDSGMGAGFAPRARTDQPVSDSIVRLHCALFNRKPHPSELEYWAGRYWSGLPLVSIADAFIRSGEFVSRHGTLSEVGLVGFLYNNVLGRDSGSSDAVLDALRSGELTRGALIVGVTDSVEYVEMTGTAPPEKPSLPYPAVGSGRRVIYNNTDNRVYLISETGELAKSHLSSGRRGIPNAGRYNVYSMSRYAWAPYDGITMEFMVRFTRAEWPYGFHSIPVWPNNAPLQTSEQLGTHRSGGCIRQEFEDAEFVFHWAEIGTRVIVIRP